MYTTTHITTSRQMIHVFDNGYEVIVDFNFNIARVRFRDKTDSFSIEDMSIEDFHNKLRKYGTDKSN